MKRELALFQEIVGEDHVAVGPAARAFAGLPDAWIVAPGDPGELERTMALAHDRSIPVVVAGTSVRGLVPDALPRGRAVVLDLRRLDSLLALDDVSLTVTAQTGIPIATLERALVRRGYTLGFPLSGFAERVSLGGCLAGGVPPLASPSRGRLAEHVVATSFVLADGTRVRTRHAPRQATGPDLDGLVLGCRGRLGVITEATLRLYREPEERLLLGFGFESTAEAVRALGALTSAGLPPTSAGIWPAGPEARRGARLAATFVGSAEWTRGLAAAAKKELRAAGGRPDPAPDDSWFAHADRAAARLGAEREPVWAYGDFESLAAAASLPAFRGPAAAFGIPAFDRHGGYAVAAGGAGGAERLDALRSAGCRPLTDADGNAAPLSETARRLLERLATTLDPRGVLACGGANA